MIGSRSTPISAEMISLVFRPEPRPLKLIGAPEVDVLTVVTTSPFLYSSGVPAASASACAGDERLQHVAGAVAHLDPRASALLVAREAQFAALRAQRLVGLCGAPHLIEHLRGGLEGKALRETVGSSANGAPVLWGAAEDLARR